MSTAPLKRAGGFTLVELIVSMTLSLMIMGAVLSSYVFLGRNFARSLGISATDQPNLEAQGRRALAYFTQDVRMASGLSGTPSASSLTLTQPTSSGITTVTYTYDSTAKTLTRTPAGGTALVLHTHLLSSGFYFRYFDASGNPYDNGNSPYTTIANYLSGIKQLSMTFSCQAGSSANGTLTQVYQVASPRLILRNRQLLP